MDLHREHLDLMVMYGLRLLWDEISTNWGKLARDMGLTLTEVQILWIISLSHSSTVTEVAYCLQRDKGTVSKSIYSLEQNGLIQRSEGEDRRFYDFTVSEKGNELLNQLGEAHAKGFGLTFVKAFVNLEKEERESFAQIIIKLVRQVYGEHYILDFCKMPSFPKVTAEFLKSLLAKGEA